MIDRIEPEFSNKDKIEVLFREYDTLRSEIIARSDSQQKYLTIGAALIAGVLTLGEKKEGVGMAMIVAASSIVATVSIVSAVLSSRHTAQIGKYIRTIESEINRLAGGQRLMGWENSYRGPIAQSGVTTPS